MPSFRTIRSQPCHRTLETSLDIADRDGLGYVLSDLDLRYTTDADGSIEDIHVWGYVPRPRGCAQPGRIVPAPGFAWLRPPTWFQRALEDSLRRRD